MATLPAIMSGRVAFKYPAARSNVLRSGVHVFCDFTEQRYRKGVGLVEFDLTYRRISTADKETLRIFWIERQGETDTTWDMTFEGIQYTHCRFVGPRLELINTGPGLWDVKLRIKGKRGATI